MTFTVRLTPAVLDDLLRLFEHMLARAETAEELDQADAARATIVSSLRKLESSPFLYRKAGDNAFLRELIVPFGSNGYVVLYEIVDAHHVDVLAVRHQREDDYH